MATTTSNGSGSKSSATAAGQQLTVRHIKIPEFIIPILQREADNQQRHMSFVVREALVMEAQRLAKRHEAEDARVKSSIVAQKRRSA